MRNFYDIFLFFSWQKLPSASKNPTQDTFVFFDRCFFSSASHPARRTFTHWYSHQISHTGQVEHQLRNNIWNTQASSPGYRSGYNLKMFFCLFVFCCSEPHTCARLLIDGLTEEKTRCVWTLSSPWRRCHKTPRCCWGTVCWDRRVRRTERRRRPDLSPSSRCSATPWGSWSHPCPSLPSSWTWLRWPVHLGAVGIKKRKKENWLSECGRVWHWREWLFLPILFRVELRSRREKFTCASKPWLCVKRELETVRWMKKKL